MIENNATVASWPILVEAHRILTAAVRGVPADGWGAATPCEQWSVAQVAEHAGLDQLLYVSALTGAAKPAGDAFQPTGELAEDPAAFVADAVAASAAAFAEVGVDAEGVPVPLPPFALPAAAAVGAAALDAAVHGWDIAVATGQPVTLSEHLVHELFAVAQNLVEPLRGWGAYAPAITTAQDADDTARLLNYLGRRADWSR